MKYPAALVVCLAAHAALAQVDPVVRMEVEPSSVRVGEALSLRVTVLVPTFFLRPPVYPDFEVANAITRLPPDSSYATSERVGRESWSGIVRRYRIYPLAAANYRIDGATMRVTYSDPGGLPVVRDVAVPAVSFSARVPVGAENLDPYVAGRSLELSLDVEGDDGELAVGDAVVLNYRAVLDGLPSVFLPELSPGIAGAMGADAVTVYSDAPRFDDDAGVATRAERVTLVFKAGGELSVPAVVIDYWDMTAGELRTARTEPLLFSVAGPPPGKGSSADAAAESEDRWPLALLAGALALGLAMAFLAWRSSIRELLRDWQASEAYAFRQLRRDLKVLGEEEIYRRLQCWLARLESGLGPRAFAGIWGDAALRADIDALSAHAFGGRQQKIDPRALEARLVAARRRFLSRGEARRDACLEPLNP